MPQREPLFNFSEPAPVWLGAVLVLAFIVQSFSPDDVRSIIYAYALLASENGEIALNRGGISNLWSLGLHGFLHASWMHLIINSLMIAVFGVLVARVGGTAKFLLIFGLSVIAGGFSQWGYWILAVETSSALGASGGASGLFAAGAWVMGGRKKLVQFGFGWLFINVAIEFFGAVGFITERFAWPAHLGGFVMGGVLSMILLRPNSTIFTFTR